MYHYFILFFPQVALFVRYTCSLGLVHGAGRTGRLRHQRTRHEERLYPRLPICPQSNGGITRKDRRFTSKPQVCFVHEDSPSKQCCMYMLQFEKSVFRNLYCLYCHSLFYNHMDMYMYYVCIYRHIKAERAINIY